MSDANGKTRWAVIAAVLMALVNIGVILYAAGRQDGDVGGRLGAIEARLQRIERILDRQFGP